MREEQRRALRRAQRSGEIPSRLDRMPVRVDLPAGWSRADTIVHEAAHAAAAIALGMPVLAILVGVSDGMLVLDHAGAPADDVGIVSVAGASACNWRWIGLGDAILCEHALAALGREVSPVVRSARAALPALCPCPGAEPRGGSAGEDVRGWARGAAEILSGRASLHARICLAIAARGGVLGWRELAAIASREGPRPRRGGLASRLWRRAEGRSGVGAAIGRFGDVLAAAARDGRLAP